MAKAKAVSKKADFWHSRQGHISIVCVALLAAYFIASRALDTGSLIEYFFALSLIGIAINRGIKAFSN